MFMNKIFLVEFAQSDCLGSMDRFTILHMFVLYALYLLNKIKINKSIFVFISLSAHNKYSLTRVLASV